MARDELDAVLAELTAWAGSRTPPSGVNVDEAETLLRFLRDYRGVEDPADIGPADLRELLLDVYPRKVTVLERGDAADVVPTVRELLAFLSDTGRIASSAVADLRRAVDGIESQFLDAMMDPAKWGPARSIAQGMAADGVDFSDQDAVNRWIQRYNEQLPASPYDGAFGPDADDLFDDFPDDDLVNLKEVLGLPDQVPPLRLPSAAELADAARGSALIAQAKRLALWTGKRTVTSVDGELPAADAVAAARVLGLADVPGEVREMADLPELWQLWELADELEFIELADEDAVAPGSDAQDWPDCSDEDVLDIWQHALADTIFSWLPRAADLGDRDDLDFTGVGAALVVLLFLARGEGAPVTELSGLIKESATAELPPSRARKAWSSWLDRCGDPAEALCGRLVELGAVKVDASVVRLTPLSQYAMRLQMIDNGVDVPLLPPVEDMTVADLVEFGKGADDEEMAVESEAWLALRSPEVSTEELLTFAAAGGPADRAIATSIAAKVSGEARSQWKQALDDPGLRPYAKITLAQLGGEAGGVGADLEPTVADVAWLLTDTLAAMADELEPEGIADQLSEAVPAGQEQQVFEAMWRLDHPQVHEVLTLLGKHHPDKKVAKAARKAAFKVAPRSTRG